LKKCETNGNARIARWVVLTNSRNLWMYLPIFRGYGRMNYGWDIFFVDVDKLIRDAIIMEFLLGGIVFLGFFYIALLMSEKLGRNDDEYWRNKGGK